MNIRGIVAGAAVWAVVCGTAGAAKIDLNGNVEGKVASGYVWRGMVLNEEPVFQPSVTLDFNTYFSMNCWGTWDLTDQEGTWNRNRVDTSLQYMGVNGEHIFRSGVTAYLYNDSVFARNNDTFEVFVGYTWDTLTLPSIKVYYDFSEFEGTYATFSLAHSFELSKEIALDVRGVVGGGNRTYAREFFSRSVVDANSQTNRFVPDGSRAVDFTASLDLPMFFGKHGVFTPGIAYTVLISKDIRDALEANDEKTELFVGSLTLAYTF